MMRFAPPTVVDTVIMITCTRNCSLIEIRILADCCCRHKATSRMSVDSHTRNINKSITVGKLLYCCLMVGQRIIPHISISVIMVPFGAAGMPTSLSYRNHDKSGLCQTVCPDTHASERTIHRFYLRPRIHIINNGIYLGRIKVKRFVHHSIQISHTVGRFYLERFREFVTGSFQRRKITFLYGHHLFPIIVQQIGTRNSIGT